MVTPLFGTKTKTQRYNPPITIRREVACQPTKVDETHLSFPCLEQGMQALQPGEIGFVRYTIEPTAGYKPDAMTLVYRSEKGKFFYMHDTETVFSLLLIQQGVSSIDDLPDPMEQNLGTLRFVMDENEYWQVINADENGETRKWVPINNHCHCCCAEELDRLHKEFDIINAKLDSNTCKCGGEPPEPPPEYINIEDGDATITEYTPPSINVEDGDVTITE